jgi:hypothetical protein
MVRLPNGIKYPLSLHNGEKSDVPDVYVKKLKKIVLKAQKKD